MEWLQAGIFLLCICSALVAAEPDISCDYKIPYIGNCINNEFALKISSPEKKQWNYQATFGNLCDPKVDAILKKQASYECTGTYEYLDDLVIFTGTTKMQNTEQRHQIGLNYKIIDGKASINAFFRDSKKELIYHKIFFQLTDNVWLPAEELKLKVLSVPEKDQKKWELKCQGTRSRWRAKQEIQEAIEVSHEYTRLKEDYYRAEKPAVGESAWLPENVSLQRSKGIVEAVYLLGSPLQVSGFTFPLAELPRK